MKTKILKGVGAILISAVTLMAATISAASAVSADNTNCVKFALSDVEAVAGQYVSVDLTTEAGNTCTGYDLGIKFDERLELKTVNGVMATCTNDNICTVINFTGTSFTDNEALTSLTFEVPEDAEAGTVYDISIATVNDFASDNTELNNAEVESGSITVNKAEHVKVFKNDETIEPIVGLRGDANNDDKVDLQDAIAMANFLVGSKSFDEKQTFFADTNNDGKIDIRDLINLCKYTTSIEKETAWEKII